MTKQEALALYGGNGSALARALGISKQAVSFWPDGQIPEAHALRIEFVLLPELRAREREAERRQRRNERRRLRRIEAGAQATA